MDSVNQKQEAQKQNNDLNNLNKNFSSSKVEYIDYSFVGKSQLNYKSGYSEYGYSDAELRQACKFINFSFSNLKIFNLTPKYNYFHLTIDQKRMF